MTFSTEDRLAIHELVALHGHLMDDGQLERLDELFTADVTYDLTAYGAGILVGIDAFRDAALAMGERNPLGHHVTNIVVTAAAGVAEVRSKGFGIRSDGTAGSVVYEDTVIKTDVGWRIASRRVLPRRTPLSPD